jgi:hypothetical protein
VDPVSLVLNALTAAGVLLKAEPSSYGVSEFFLGLAILFAVGGFRS